MELLIVLPLVFLLVVEVIDTVNAPTLEIFEIRQNRVWMALIMIAVIVMALASN